MSDIAKLARERASLLRLRNRLRMAGSSMLSVDPSVLQTLPFTLSSVFAAIESLDGLIGSYDLPGGGGG